MSFRVIVTNPAFEDIEGTVQFIRAESFTNARQWLSDCWQAVDSLKEMPFRQPVIPEANAIGIPYRSLPLHSHRLIYRVDEERSVIYVVRVYHGARKPLTFEGI